MRRWNWRGALYGLVTLGVWLPLLVKAEHKLAKGNDFETLHGAAQALWSGAPLYGAESAYMYPPLFAYLLLPLAPLPGYVAGLIWTFLKVPLFYYCAAVLLPRDRLSASHCTALMVFSPLLVYRFLDSDLANGNSNLYLLAGVVAALQCAARSRDGLSGLLLAVVASVKLAPAYLGLCLGAAGRWRILVSLALFLPILLVGPALPLDGGVARSLQGFYHTSRAVFHVGSGAELEDAPPAYLPGQSLRPILHRWLTSSDATAHDGGRVVKLNLVAWKSTTVERIYLATAVVLALVGLLACRGQGLSWTFAWGAAVLLLISPYSRKAHFLLLLPAALLVVEAWLAGAPRRSWLGGFLGASLALGQLTTPAIWGKANAALLVGGGVVGAAAMAILPAMWIIRAQNHEE